MARLLLKALPFALLGLALAGCPGNLEPPPPPPPEDAGPPPCPEAQVCLDDCCEEGDLCGVAGCVAPEACSAARTCGTVCCDEDELCGEGEVCGSIDLVPVSDGVAETILLEATSVREDSCENVNNCMRGFGDREVLKFDAKIANLGDVAFEVPTDLGSSPACGDAPQLEGLIAYEVRDSVGNLRLDGDVAPTCIAGGDGFACEASMGLAPGGESALPGGTCPVVDATGMAMGSYTLVIIVDPNNLIAESDETNNRIEVPFEIACRDTMCGGICCPDDKCSNDVCQLPDLHVDQQAMIDTIEFTTEFFPEGSCAIFEGCVVEPGERRLLRFDTLTPNLGNTDLFLGDPSENEDIFEFSECHNHHHFESYANYRLLNLDGTVAARGHKQAFCLIDTDRIDPTAGPAQYNCGFQGITRGWGDTYNAGLDCQWVDVTGVRPGQYELEVTVNGQWVLDELDYNNNTSTAIIEIPDDPNQCFPDPEICGDGADQDCDGVPDNGCPPITGLGQCENPLELPNNGVFRFTAEDAAVSASSCGGEGPGGFFRVAVPTDEIIYFSTYAVDEEGNASPADTVLTIYSDTCDGTELTCTDDACGTTQSHIAREFTAGAYLIEARFKDAGATGDLQLRMQRAFCGGAEPMDGSGSYEGNNSDGNNEQRPVGCAFNGGDAPEDFWFFTTCPGENNVDFSICGAEFDSMLEIREGICNSSAAVICNDDEDGCGPNGRASHINTDLRGEGAGDGLWFLMVDGFREQSSGAYSLEATIE